MAEEKKYDIGLMGLAVMGQNLVLNMVDHGFDVAVFNRTTSKVDDFLATPEAQSKGDKLVGAHSLKELVSKLKSPRKIMLMIKSKDAVPAPELALYPENAAVDAVIAELLPLLDKGDVIIDGGNTQFKDTERRTQYLQQRGIRYIGTGVSGGEEGARRGPSMMPGGDPEAWPLVKPIFQAISAKVGPNHDVPCCDWIGDRGAGHYVKMVHNGVEYGDMQLISDAYWILKNALGLSNKELYEIFAEWNKTELDSYLVEITRDIFTVDDPETGKPLLDLILDCAGAKGTGKWMSQLALDLGVPSTLVTEAVYARAISAMKSQRVNASKALSGPEKKFEGNRDEFIAQVKQRFTLRRSVATRKVSCKCKPPRRNTVGPWIADASPFSGAADASSARYSLNASRKRSTRTPRSKTSSSIPTSRLRSKTRKSLGATSSRRRSNSASRRPASRPRSPITTASAPRRSPRT